MSTMKFLPGHEILELIEGQPLLLVYVHTMGGFRGRGAGV